MKKAPPRAALGVLVAAALAAMPAENGWAEQASQDAPEYHLEAHPRGSGTLLELGVGDHGRIAQAFPTLFATSPGVKIVGKGRSLTVVRGPLHFRGPYPELDEISVICESEADTATFVDHAQKVRRACVIFENAVTASTGRVTIRNDVVGAWSLVHIATEAGSPTEDWRAQKHGGTWPYRHVALSPLWRDSKSEHRELEVLSVGGGGVYAANLVTRENIQAWRSAFDKNCCEGNFTNHLRFFGGHVAVGGAWMDVQAWLGLRERPGWQERFAPMAAFELHDFRVETVGLHADVFPHLGVLLYGRAKFTIGMGSSFIEPLVNWGRTRRNPENAWRHDSPAWIIGGDAAGCPVWSDGPSRAVRAGNFEALLWPPYIYGPNKGNALFECSADW